VVPLEIARVCPGWLWAGVDEFEADFDENEWDPDLPVPDETCARIKQAFIDEIERLEPGYIETIRITRDRCLRPLFELACFGFRSTEDIKMVERVVSVAEQLYRS